MNGSNAGEGSAHVSENHISIQTISNAPVTENHADGSDRVIESSTNCVKKGNVKTIYFITQCFALLYLLFFTTSKNSDSCA